MFLHTFSRTGETVDLTSPGHDVIEHLSFLNDEDEDFQRNRDFFPLFLSTGLDGAF